MNDTPTPNSQPEHAPSAEADPLRRLSDELVALAQTFHDREVTLGEVMSQLGARASALLMVILTLPFCAPVSIPGLSTPFGIVIVFLATRYALGLPPWLPRKLLATQLPPKFFGKLMLHAGKLIGWIERKLRPRWLWLTPSPAITRMHALAVIAAGLLLLLPLGGIPLTNTLPALAIVVLTLGVIERDGVAIIVAYLLVLATVIYFGTFAAVIVTFFQEAWEWISARVGGG